MSWLAIAAQRARLKGAESLEVASTGSASEPWEEASRSLGLAPLELLNAIAPAVGIQVANLDKAEASALALLPEKVARRYGVFPLREDDRTFTVATSNPTDLVTEQAIDFATGRRTKFELALPQQIRDAINSWYSPDRAVERLLLHVDEEIADVVKVVEETAPEAVAEKDIAAGPVVKLTNLILRDAIASGASDIHVEPGPKGGVVRTRIDGVLRTQMTLPLGAVSRIVSRIKVLAKLDIADRTRPQDGRARVAMVDKTFDLRVSTVPTRESEKAVVRILRPDATRTLDRAGLSAHDLVLIRQLLGFREGVVLVTGPTGSGKTTTLYAALREIVGRNVNITTVEDPIEYELQGITQIQVEPKRGVTFASALRAILRQDPDVIFVGEIRDEETAEVSAQAALTGHLVLSTLHTNDAISVVTRLQDLGLPRATIASSLRGSVAQRLVRRVCPDCKVTVNGDLTSDEKRLMQSFGVAPVVRAAGCSACGGSGYRGRLPVVEVAVMTPALIESISSGASVQAMTRIAIAGGMRTLRDAALERVASGETTLQEVERVIGEGVHAGASEEEPAKEHPAATDRPVVLLVDDDAVLRRVGTKILESAGCEVEVAADGREAMQRLNGIQNVSLVVTDLHMPELDGLEVLTAVRDSETLSDIPVIILTSDEDRDQEIRLMDAGADDYVRKPVDPERLVARVRAALRRRSA